MTMRTAARLGALAEDEVAHELERRGVGILGRNVRVGRYEIDILARSADLVIVVEVRHRGSGAWQGPFESISRSKRKRLRTAARQLWNERFDKDPTFNRMRLDVASVEWGADGTSNVEYVEGVYWESDCRW